MAIIRNKPCIPPTCREREPFPFPFGVPLKLLGTADQLTAYIPHKVNVRHRNRDTYVGLWLEGLESSETFRYEIEAGCDACMCIHYHRGGEIDPTMTDLLTEDDAGLMANYTPRSVMVVYNELFYKYIEKGLRLMQQDDYAQASEKYWEAAAEMAKLLADKRGVKLDDDRSLSEFVANLSNEHPERNLSLLFSAATVLHGNVYQDYLPSARVTELADVVEDFIDELLSL